eukprot:COSAG01_NODE_36549_length_516_cov_0.856115_1_plen_82_part_10
MSVVETVLVTSFASLSLVKCSVRCGWKPVVTIHSGIRVADVEQRVDVDMDPRTLYSVRNIHVFRRRYPTYSRTAVVSITSMD